MNKYKIYIELGLMLTTIALITFLVSDYTSGKYLLLAQFSFMGVLAGITLIVIPLEFYFVKSLLKNALFNSILFPMLLIVIVSIISITLFDETVAGTLIIKNYFIAILFPYTYCLIKILTYKKNKWDL